VQHKLPSDPTLSQKRAVFPAFSSREVTLGQMRKIGIHFIIYRSSCVGVRDYYMQFGDPIFRLIAERQVWIAYWARVGGRVIRASWRGVAW